MNQSVVLLRQKAPGLNRFLAALPSGAEPLAVSLPPELAHSIRFTAGMHSKDPQEFLIDWLKSGFPENAA